MSEKPEDHACHCCHDHAASGDGDAGRPAPSADDPGPVPDGYLLSRLRIAQMDCPTEEAMIRRKLDGHPEVHRLQFDLMQRVLTVVHAEGALPRIEAAIRELGMVGEVLSGTPDGNPGNAATPGDGVGSWWPLALGGFAALGAEVAHWLAWSEWLAALLALAAIAACGTGTYRKGWIALRHGSLNINALMSLAVTGAVLLQQWPEAAMVMVLFTLAERIEARSLERARRAIRGLLQLAPERAMVRQPDGRWVERPCSEIAIGARVRVRPGERIALDGVVSVGRSTVDQAPITGESLPVDKAPGDTVFAGTINATGEMEFTVTAPATDSTLARIIHAVEKAQASRAPIQRFIDRFAARYTPAVVGLALLLAVVPPLLFDGEWAAWIYKALVLLVIACPCALVISTPVTVVSALTAAARHGILVKGGAHLEGAHDLAWLALDKTGTVTTGKPALTDTVVLETAGDPVRIAVALAARSDHPVSRALVAGYSGDLAMLPAVADFSALPGRGVTGNVDGVGYTFGNHRLIHELGVCSDDLEAQIDPLEAQGKTVLLLTDGVRVFVLFAVADTIRAGSREAVDALHALGVRTVMLTGDNLHTAQMIAAQAGVDEVQGDLLPEDKLRAVARLAERGKVGMVGDGINDAPALARADIGFAMGAAGTDTAIETADVALMDDDLGKIARFIRLSRTTRRILVQNIALALGIKAVFMALAAAGMATLWMAVFADMGASLLVVANGLRALRA
jgi:Cd2+/Zn2+-exporting ATPase